MNLPKSSTEKLQRIMRSAARLIAQPKRNASVTEICRELHWLPIPQRAQFKVLTLVYKALHNGAPSYISAMLQPYEPQRTLLTPRATDFPSVVGSTPYPLFDRDFGTVW